MVMKTSGWLNLIGFFLITLILVGCRPTQGITMFDGKIIFRSNRDGNFDLYVMNPDGSGVKKLASIPDSTAPPTDNNGMISSPDGRQVGFISDRDGNFEIYVVDLENGILTNLTRNPADDCSFAWSPDGKSIAFISERDAALMSAERALRTNDVYIMDSKGTNVLKLTANNTTNSFGELSWSPDGKQLAFSMSSLSRNGPFVSNISVIGLDNFKLTILTSPSDLVRGSPIWSPDGNHILYSVSRSGSCHLSVMNADGTEPVDLTEDDLGFVISEFWSPDGRYILFSSKKDNQYSFYIVKPDGTDMVTLSKGPFDTSPSWSPDGKHIVFSSKDENGKYHLYIMNADGTDKKRLTNGPGEEVAPIWLPFHSKQ